MLKRKISITLRHRGFPLLLSDAQSYFNFLCRARHLNTTCRQMFVCIHQSKNPTCLSVCEVIVAEFFPQQPVFSEGPQIQTHLAQTDQVPAIWQTLHDVQLQTGRQVSQSHASTSGLRRKRGRHLDTTTTEMVTPVPFSSVCSEGRSLLYLSGCCPAAAATAGCFPYDEPRCWCSPPGQTCPCPERDCTVRRTTSAAALWWDGRSVGHLGLWRVIDLN